jgi:hypothetical protein
MGAQGQQFSHHERFFDTVFVRCKSGTIGVGSYGQLLKVVDQKTGRQLAAKLTCITNSANRLQPAGCMRKATFENEVKAYMQLQAGVEGGEAHKNGIPLVLAYGVFHAGSRLPVWLLVPPDQSG